MAETVLTLGGEPIQIHLHSTLSKGARKAIAKKIVDAGGEPRADLADARVIICRPDHPSFKILEHKFDHDRYKWVESPSWVDVCISEKKYEHLPRDGAGRRTNYARAPFTEEDDQNIVKYLALRIPFKQTGGRNGFLIWKDLCSEDRKELYPWASHHPWQSWRERYVKNQDIFDPRIEAAVKSDPDPPHPGGKGQYRIRYGKGTRPRVLHEVTLGNEGGEEEEEEEAESEEGPVTSPEKRKRPSHVNPVVASKRRDTGKGKSRQQPIEEVNDALDYNYDIQDDNDPGPSNWMDDPPQQSAASPELPVKAPERTASKKNNDNLSRATVASSFSQTTLVPPHSSQNQAPVDTQKTVVPSSPPPPKPRRQAKRTPVSLEQPRTRVTRAYNPPELNLQKLPTSGRTRAAKKTAANENQPLRTIPEDERKSISVRDEVQVEAILKIPVISAQIEVPPNEPQMQSSSGESESDDDDTAQMLRKTNEIVQQGARQSRQPALTIAEPPPPAPRTRSKNADILGPSSMLNARTNTDPDATPKAAVRSGAKKMASTRYLSDAEDEDAEGDDDDDDEDEEEDSHSPTGATTDSSIPVGTKAEERVRSEKTSRRKGGARGRKFSGAV